MSDERRHSETHANIRRALTNLGQSSTDIEQFSKKSSKFNTLSSRNGKINQILQEQAQKAYDELAKKDEDLRLAAQIGQQLLEKIDHYEDEVSELQEKLDVSERDREMILEQRKALEKKMGRSEVLVEHLQHTIDDLKTEIEDLSASLDKERMSGGGVNSEVVVEELQRLQVKFKDVSAKYEKCNEELRVTKEQLEKATDDLEDSAWSVKELDSVRKQLQAVEGALEERAALRDRNQELEEENHRHLVMLRELAQSNKQLNEELEDARRDLDHMNSSMHDLRPGDAMSQSMPSLALLMTPEKNTSANVRGIRSPSIAEEFTAVEDEDDVEVVEVIEEEDEDDGGGGGGSKPVNEELPAAIVTVPPAKIEEEKAAVPAKKPGIFGRLFGSKKPGSPSPKDTNAAATTTASSPESDNNSSSSAYEKTTESYDENEKMREFFFLTLQAYKLTISPDMLEHVATVSTRKLWAKALKQKVAYFHFPSWIKNEINHAYIERMYNSDAGAASNERSSGDRSVAGLSTALGSTRTRNASRHVKQSYKDKKDAGAALSATQSNYQPRVVASRQSRTASRVADIAPPQH